MQVYLKKVMLKVPEKIKKFLYGDIKEDLQEVKSTINVNEKDHLRHEILSFASSLRRGEKHTTQEFETIFAFHDKYELLIEKLNQKNGYTHSEFEYIQKQFEKERGL